MAWVLQEVPFHRSANAPALEPPTAVQAEDDVHATPDKNAPAGPGAGWICQLVPFQRSTSTLRGVPGDDPATAPTAVQAEGDAHATPARKAPAGLGAGWTRQLLPSHRSASALPGVPGADPPTAVHAVGEVHDTPTR